MKKIIASYFLLALCFSVSSQSLAQAKTSRTSGTKVKPPTPAAAAATPPVNDPVLLTVAGDNIPRSEFDRVFRKNNNKDSTYDEKAVREYLDLYVNYKLKVKE